MLITILRKAGEIVRKDSIAIPDTLITAIYILNEAELVTRDVKEK